VIDLRTLVGSVFSAFVGLLLLVLKRHEDATIALTKRVTDLERSHKSAAEAVTEARLGVYRMRRYGDTPVLAATQLVLDALRNQLDPDGIRRRRDDNAR
jgi:hypothetical protein